MKPAPKDLSDRERRALQLSLFDSPVLQPNVGADLLSRFVDRNEGLLSQDMVLAGAAGASVRPWSQRELESWAPPDSSLVSEWAEKYRILAPDFSAFPGPWEHRAYYAIEVMDAFLDPLVEELTLMAAAQSVKTDAVYNMLGYAIDQDPAPTLIVMPTLLTLGRVNDRIKSMIKESPVLAKHLTGNDDDLTAKKIRLNNMPIYFATAGSSADLRNVLARYVILDEVDDYPESTGKGSQGSPIGQAEKRAITYWNRKIIKLCTPTTETGYINVDFQKSDRRNYWVPCPHCLGYQVLTPRRLKHVGCKLGEWPKDKRGEDYILAKRVTRYECEHCGQEIEERHKPWMDRMGTWVPEGHPIERDGSVAIPMPRSRHRGYHWGGQLSPFVTWDQMTAEFFQKKDDPEDLKVYVNLTCGEVYEEATVKREVDEIMALRTERSALIVPEGTVALTAGVDNQKHGKWIAIRAWVRDGASVESHLIRNGFVETFEDLERWIFQDVYQVENSRTVLPIWRGAIDIGGTDTDDFEDETMTEAVYDWLRAHGRGVMFGIKGSSRQIGGGKKMRSSIIDRYPSRRGKVGKPIPGGLKLWLIDTALVKNAVWSRIDTGKFHVHADIDATYAKHMTAEQKEKTPQGKTIWKVKGHRANHLFDAEVYAAAMADPECDGGIWVLPGNNDQSHRLLHQNRTQDSLHKKVAENLRSRIVNPAYRGS